MPAGILLFVSSLAGLVGAMSGVGGGVILIPFLTYFGMDIKQAIALSILSVIAVSNGAAPYYVRRHIPNLKVSNFLELFAVTGSLVGASVTVVAARRPLFFLCGSIILVSGAALWKRRHEKETANEPDPLSRRLELSGSYYDEALKRTVPYQARRVPLGGLLMFGAGAVSGSLGIGGSALTVLINNLVIGLPPKVSLATSNLIIGIMGLAGAVIYLKAGLLDPRMAVPVVLGVSVGSLAGSKFLIGLTNNTIRLILLCILILFGVQMIVHGIRGV